MGQKITDIVREVIMKHPDTKTDNRLLVWNVWELQLQSIKVTEHLEFRWMKHYYLDGKLSNAESIIRIKNRLMK